MISVHFQGKPFNITVIQVYAPTSNAEEVEIEWLYEDIQDFLELTPPKDVHDPDNHDGVITHPEPNILECEVKWALGRSLRTKLVEVMEFPLSYFKS